MRSRGHAGCVGCPWEKAEPPKCSGHVAGPSSCRERPDSDRFAKPLCAHEDCEKLRLYNGWCENHQPVSPEESKAAKDKVEQEQAEAELERIGREHEQIEYIGELLQAKEKAEKERDEQCVRADTFAGEHVWAINSLENAGVVEKRIHHGIDILSHRTHKAEAALAVCEKERDEAQLLADGVAEGSASWEADAKEYKQERDEALDALKEATCRTCGKELHGKDQCWDCQRLALGQTGAREAEALAGQAVLLTALQGQACMCTSHRVCARCEALTNRSGRVREIMAAVRIAPKLIEMLSQVPVEILWIRQCRHDLLDSEDAKLVLGACKTRLKVLSSAPGVNKEAP